MTGFDPRVIFSEIQPKGFQSYRELEAAVFTKFNAYLNRFPVHFTHRDLIRWGFNNQWIQADDSRFVIKI